LLVEVHQVLDQAYMPVVVEVVQEQLEATHHLIHLLVVVVQALPQALQDRQFLGQAVVVVHSLHLELWAASAAGVTVVEFLAELLLNLEQQILVVEQEEEELLGQQAVLG
jgi:hypothetical protein